MLPAERVFPLPAKASFDQGEPRRAHWIGMQSVVGSIGLEAEAGRNFRTDVSFCKHVLLWKVAV